MCTLFFTTLLIHKQWQTHTSHSGVGGVRVLQGRIDSWRLTSSQLILTLSVDLGTFRKTSYQNWNSGQWILVFSCQYVWPARLEKTQVAPRLNKASGINFSVHSTIVYYSEGSIILLTHDDLHLHKHKYTTASCKCESHALPVCMCVLHLFNTHTHTTTTTTYVHTMLYTQHFTHIHLIFSDWFTLWTDLGHSFLLQPIKKWHPPQQQWGQQWLISKPTWTV